MKLILLFPFLLKMVEGSDPGTVFVKRGDHLRLAGPHTLSLTEFEDFFVKHQNNSIIKCDHSLNCKTRQKYEGRAEFSTENNSLMLKNVMFNDSGVYTFVIHDGEDHIKVKYNVNVQDSENLPESSASQLWVGLGVILALVVFVLGFFFFCRRQMRRLVSSTLSFIRQYHMIVSMSLYRASERRIHRASPATGR